MWPETAVLQDFDPACARIRVRLGPRWCCHCRPQPRRCWLRYRPIQGYEFAFSTDARRPISGFSTFKLRFDITCGVAGWRFHDLRRTARSLMSRAGVNPDIAERCLGHVIPGVRGVYDRHRYEAEMLHAFEALAAQIDRTLNPPGDNVVALGGTG